MLLRAGSSGGGLMRHARSRKAHRTLPHDGSSCQIYLTGTRMQGFCTHNLLGSPMLNNGNEFHNKILRLPVGELCK
jgi:hypothetical protein